MNKAETPHAALPGAAEICHPHIPSLGSTALLMTNRQHDSDAIWPQISFNPDPRRLAARIFRAAIGLGRSDGGSRAANRRNT
jgi:hypothetical protein